MKRFLFILLALALLFTVTACYEEQPPATTPTTGKEENAEQTQETEEVEEPIVIEHPLFVQFEMENGDTFVVELYPEYAPRTVVNFQKLVAEGFYDGLTFHRVVKGFMIQGGCPEGNGYGSAESTIKGEFAQNGFAQNTLKHERGVISMARSSAPNSASCQFFIVHETTASLDGKYAAFGRVVEGMETVDAIATVAVEKNPSGEKSKPVDPIVIKEVTFLENYVAE